MPKKGFFIFIVGAYLIRSSIKDITEAIKWKAYYGSHGDKPLPPGYYAKKAECGKWSESVKASKLPKTEAAIENAINSAFNDEKREKELVEGQKETSGRYPYNEGWGEKELRESIEKARKAGVPESQILHEASEIDRYFGYDKSTDDDCDSCRIDIPASETLNEDEGSDN